MGIYEAAETDIAKAIQKEVGVPEDGLTTTVGPDPKGIHVGGSSDVGDVSFCTPTMGAIVSCWPQHIPRHPVQRAVASAAYVFSEATA